MGLAGSICDCRLRTSPATAVACWALMIVLLALGAMSVVPLLILATVVLTEKLWTRGEAFSRLMGVVSLGLAVATIWIPELAPGFMPRM